MPTYSINAPDGNTYSIDGPEGATKEQVIAEILRRNPYAAKTTEELNKAPAAPFSMKDTASSAYQSAVGGIKGLRDVFGAGSEFSQSLEKSIQESQAGMTPERQEEMRRRAELMGRAKTTGEEVKSFAGAVTEAPLQSTVSGLASMAPTIALAGGLAAVVASAPIAIAAGVGIAARLLLGAAQGAGEAKGNIYEKTKAELIANQGRTPEQAEIEAQEAQSYLGKNWKSIAGSAAVGSLDVVTGAEKGILNAISKTKKLPDVPTKAPNVPYEFTKATVQEAVPEGLQGFVGQVGENVAMQNIGVDTPTFKGATGAFARDALVGALTGAAVSPVQISSLKNEFAQSQLDEKAKKQADELATLAKTYENLNVTDQKLLPKPPEEEVVKAPEPVDILRDPFGKYTKADVEQIEPGVWDTIQQNRKDQGLPVLESYSIEDIVKNQPEAAEGVKNIASDLVSLKSEFKPENVYTPEQVLSHAKDVKNVNVTNQGFKDFLGRATGINDLAAMSQPQLHAAFKAIDNLPVTPKPQVLPTGTSATQYTQAIYDSSIQSVIDKVENVGAPIERKAAIDNIMSSGVNDVKQAERILEDAVKNKSLELDATNKIAAPDQIPMPEGVEIQEATYKAGEQPVYEIYAGDKKITTLTADEEAARQRYETMQNTRAGLAKEMESKAAKEQKRIDQSQSAIDRAEAQGLGTTPQFQVMQTRHNATVADATNNIAAHNAKIAEYTQPLELRQIGSKAATKQGYKVLEKGELKGVFFGKTPKEGKAQAQQSILTQMTDDDLLSALSTSKSPREKASVERELKAREETKQRQETGKSVFGDRKAGEKVSKEFEEAVKEAEKVLRARLDKMGLKSVAVNLAKKIREGDEGVYEAKLIQIAMDAGDPLRVLNHEAIHALKDLGFFSDAQWKSLTDQAKSRWVNQFLKQRNIDGQPIQAGQESRYDAYMKLYNGDMDIVIEEAIADAFADFANKPPPGMLAALAKRIREFFQAIADAFKPQGFERYEQIFAKIEAGQLKEGQAGAGAARASFKRAAVAGESEISTQNPQGPNRLYDPITDMLSIDEDAVKEAMKINPKLKESIINAIKAYGFIPKGIADKDVISVFKDNMVNNLLYLYDKVPENIRQRSKLWYDGANRISKDLAKRYNMTPEQVAGIAAAMSPQKDWFQNVSMAERAIDILTNQGESTWTPNMLKYAESYIKEADNRQEREKRQIAFDNNIQPAADNKTKLKDMNLSAAAAFVRAYDEAFNTRDYRIVTPEGGFDGLVTKNNGDPATMTWSTYNPIEKTVSIFRDKGRSNISDMLGEEHKIRSFYNNIIAPNSDISHVTVDTHAVAAALFEALAGTDIEVIQNFGGFGSKKLGVGGTYGIIADAYREAAEQRGVKAREMQSITWEAVRGLFNEDIKTTIQKKIKVEWDNYKQEQQTFDQTRENILEIAQKAVGNEVTDPITPPDWIDSDRGIYVSEGGGSYDKTFKPEGGVRLREEKEIRERVSVNLSSVTESIPGLKELYERSLKGDADAFNVLQKVAEARLKFLLGKNARVEFEGVKGVYSGNREPAINAAIVYQESDSAKVLAALSNFADAFNQEQIHVLQKTGYDYGHQFGDGSYVTYYHEIETKTALTNAQIEKLLKTTGIPALNVSGNVLSTYYVSKNDEKDSDLEKYTAQVKQVNELVGKPQGKIKTGTRRIYVYGSGDGARIGYESIRGDVYPSESSDRVTPKLISEYVNKQPTVAFKQKALTKDQVKSQKLLAEVYEELPVSDLKNPLVMMAYNALNKALVALYKVMPIKANVMANVEIDGKTYPYWGKGSENLKNALEKGMSPKEADETIEYLQKHYGEPSKDWKSGILSKIKPANEDPYKNLSDRVRDDVSLKNRLMVFKTTPSTFGPKGAKFTGHPLLRKSGLTDINGYPMLYNDILRAVHDYFAHNLSDTSFGPTGEYAAALNHMASTIDPLARWALIAETRLQNAWQNFRPNLETIPLSERGFAVQKASLPPVQFTLTGNKTVDAPMIKFINSLSNTEKLGSLPSSSKLASKVLPKEEKVTARASLRSAPDTPEFKRWFKDSKIVDKDGNPRVMYHGTSRDIGVFKPNEADAIFFTDSPDFADTFTEISTKRQRDEIIKSIPEDEARVIVANAVAKALKNGEINRKGAKELLGYPIAEALEKASLLDSMTEEIESKFVTGRNIMPVYISAQNPFDFDNEAHRAEVRAKLEADLDYDNMPVEAQRKFKTDMMRIREGRYPTIERAEVQKAIRDLGFDGFYIREGSEKNLAVYKSNQVKSASGNIGTYEAENPDVRRSLRSSVRDTISAMPNGSKILDSLNEKTYAREDEGHIARMLDAMKPKSYSDIRQKLIDRYNSLNEKDKMLAKKRGGIRIYADSSAHAAALASDNAAGVTAYALGLGGRRGGIPIYQKGYTSVDTTGDAKGPVEIFSVLMKDNDPEIFRAYQFWAGAKLGKRLDAEGKEKLYEEDDYTYAKQIEKAYPQFIDVQKEWIKYNDGLVKYMLDTGVITKQAAIEWTKYGDYIPFYRQLDAEDNAFGPKVFNSLSGVRSPKARKGSDASLGDFLENVVRNTQAAIQSGMKNVAAQKTVDVLTQIGESEIKPLNVSSNDPNVITVLENGILKYYRVKDALVADAMKSLNLQDLPFLGFFAAPANLLRNLVTKDPGFMLANMMRDSLMTWTTSNTKMKPIAETVANFGKAISGQSPEFEKLMAAGLLGSHEIGGDMSASGRQMMKDIKKRSANKNPMDYLNPLKLGTSLWEALEKGTVASDAATRIAVYKRVLAETGNEAEAIYQAMETMNFNRKGSSGLVRILSATIPFLNARLQGLDVLYRAGIRPWVDPANATEYEKEVAKTFMIRGMTMAALSTLYWFMTHDDEEYRKQEQETKDNYWLIPSLGVKIPIPFEVGILFKVIPERIAAQFFGDDSAKDFRDSMKRQISSTLSVNYFIPQIALPIVEAATNHSFFTGRDIVGQGMEDIEKAYQVGPNTSAMAAWLGKNTNISPMKIDSVVNGYTGTLGMYMVQTLDTLFSMNNDIPRPSKRFEQLPFFKRFTIDPEARGAVTGYYELKNTVDSAVRTANLLERTQQYGEYGEFMQDNIKLLATKDYLLNLEKNIKQYRDMKVQVRSSTMDSDAKRDLLLEITKVENALTGNIQILKKSIE